MYVKDDNRLQHPLKKILQWLDPLLAEKQTISTKERVAISNISNELSLVAMNHTHESTEILDATSLQFDTVNNLSLIMPGIINKHHLEDMPAYYLLEPDDYQIFLIESLPVAQDEIYDALGWRLRTLLSYPLEDAVIDYFMLPPKKNATSPMVVGIVAKKSRLLEISDWFDKINMPLQMIYIPELAMRNLSSLYEDDDKSTCILYFYDKGIILNITRNKSIYFTYRLNKPVIEETNNLKYEEICLNIMRYFDYFQAQWRYPSPNRVFVISHDHHEEIAKSLSEHLLLTVSVYQPKFNLIDQQQLKKINNKCLLALGCALYDNGKYVKSGS